MEVRLLERKREKSTTLKKSLPRGARSSERSMDGTLYMLLYLMVMRVKKRRLSSYMCQHMPVCQRPRRGPVSTKLSAAAKSLEQLLW